MGAEKCDLCPFIFQSKMMKRLHMNLKHVDETAGNGAKKRKEPGEIPSTPEKRLKVTPPPPPKVKRTWLVAEVARLTGLLEKLKERVECPVCTEVPRAGPVPMCSNGHFTCSPCLASLRAQGKTDCPSCRTSMAGALGQIRSLLAGVVVENVDHRCDSEGCGEMVPFDSYNEHVEQCQFREVSCNHPDGAYLYSCSLKMAFKDLEEHKKSLCEWRQVQCHFDGCSATLRFLDTARHEEICVFRLVPCGLVLDGCKITVRIGEHEKHMEEECEFRFVPCDFDGCVRNIRSKNLVAHQEKCSYRRVKCDLEDCVESVRFNEYKKHQEEQCDSRKVSCPGCKGMVTYRYFEVGHLNVCAKKPNAWTNPKEGRVLTFSSASLMKDITWKTKIIKTFNKTFFFRIRKEQGIFSIEIVMLGQKDDCERYLAEISVLNCLSEPVFKASYSPRALSREDWGDFCFSLPQKALKKIWTFREERKVYEFQVAVNITEQRVEENLAGLGGEDDLDLI